MEEKERPIDKLSSNFCDAIDSHTFLTFLFSYQNNSTGNATIDSQAARIWTHLSASVPSIQSEKFSFPEQSAKGIHSGLIIKINCIIFVNL